MCSFTPHSSLVRRAVKLGGCFGALGMGLITSVCTAHAHQQVVRDSPIISVSGDSGLTPSKSLFGNKWVSSINLAGPIDKTQFRLPIKEREVYVLMRSWRGIKAKVTDIGIAMFLR